MIGKKKVVTVQYPDRYKKLLLQNRRRDSVIYIETKNRSNYEGTEQLQLFSYLSYQIVLKKESIPQNQ